MIGAAAMRIRCGLRVLLLLAAAMTARARAETADRIVATIDGEPITTLELRRYARERGAEHTPESQLLDALITEKLLEQEIRALGISAHENEIDRYIEEVRARSGMDEEHFRHALAGQGMTWETYRAKVKAEIEKAQLVNREIRQRVNVSPEEIKRYYEAHLDDYAVAERVKVRDVFFALESQDDAGLARARAKAQEVRGLALAGRDFGALAHQYSEGPGAEKGGELGTFGRGEMERTLEDVVFSLKPGEVSEPVQTPAGFHLLHVDQRVAASHRPLDEVRDDIRDTLYNQNLEARFQQWLTRDLRERHHVEVVD